MIELQSPITRLDSFSSNALVPLQTFEPETYFQKTLSQGNSLLSTVVVTQMDPGATVLVRYYDFTLASDDGERYNLQAHALITAPNIPGEPDRILVTKLHDKPVVEIIVANGSVKLGVYVTVVQSFASDLDSALVKDAQIANLLRDKGMPMVTYDDNQGKFFILRSENGVLPISVSEAGDAVYDSFVGVTTPGVEQALISSVVPTGKMRKITSAVVSSRSYGSYYVLAGSDIIGSGRTGPEKSKDSFLWNPRRVAMAGEVISLKFTAHASSPVNDIEAYMMSSDL